MPPFILDVYDRDQKLVGESSDFLGRAIVKIEDSEIADCRDKKPLERIPMPKWHPIRAGNNQNMPVCGHILASFALFDLDHGLSPRTQVNLEACV